MKACIPLSLEQTAGPLDEIIMDITPLPRKPIGAGSEVDAWCTRCKMDLGHRVVAMVGPAPKRVMCLTCDSEHNYRTPKSEDKKVTKKRAPATKKVGAKKAAAASSREEWEKKIQSGTDVRRYTITEKFTLEEVMTHKKFGDGYVVELLSDGKIIVRFSDGERTLVHGMTL